MTLYQVVGECAHVTVIDPAAGPAMQLLYKGAFVPEGTDQKRIEHLLSTGLIAAVNDDPAEAPLAANGSLTAVQAGTEQALKSGMAPEPTPAPASGSEATPVELSGAATPATISADAVPVQFGEEAAITAVENAPQPAASDSEQASEPAAEPAPAAETEDAIKAKQAEAQAKLDEIGGTPDGRSSDAVMVEYLVRNGYERSEVEKASRTELKGLVASVK